MLQTNTRLSRAIGVALALGAGVTMAPAQAQEQEQADDNPTELRAVEVVGSRIKSTDAETSQPVLTLDREQIQAHGRTTVGEVIQSITASGAVANSNINSGGNGQSRVSLRNIGSHRTLVLVNGRRWVGAGLSGSVDLNSIPTAAVERIEVLKDGASAIYGSDAIGGVVNVILVDEFDGAEATAYYGQYDAGDGGRESLDFMIGTSRDRFSAMLGIGRIIEGPVNAGSREISSVPVYGATPGFRGVANTPDGRFSLSPSGADPFTNDGPGTPYRPFVPGDNYNTAPDRYLAVGQEMHSVFANGRVDLTDNVRLRLTSQYVERETEQKLPVNPVVFGPLTGGYSSDMAISADSIYNPFDQDVAWGGRMLSEAGNRVITRHVDTWVANLAFEGSFTLDSRAWDWDLGYFYGRTRNLDTGEGQQDYRRMREALGPSMLDGSGNPVCVTTPGDLSSAIGGCVPLNLLGGAGSVSPEMLSYISFLEASRLGYEQRSVFANITGELFDLPAGALAFAAGVEHRKESGFDSPDPLIGTGVTNGWTREPTDGGYDVDEAYLELAIPLVEGRPGMQLLDLSVATRYSDYSNFGDTLNSKFGFRWKPVDSLLARGNWSQGFRAPNINELYQGQTGNSFANVTDPCAATLQGVPLPNPVSCAGVPADLDQAAPALGTIAGGNPDVGPETAVSRTLGLVYSPGWAQGLDLSLDWWRIELDNTISSLGAQGVINQCYRVGNDDMCGLVSRNAFGQVTTIRNVRTNLGTVEVEGYDFTAGYTTSGHDWGRLQVRLDTTYLIRNQSDTGMDLTGAGQATTGSNVVGSGSNWRVRANLMLGWQRDTVGANWLMRYFSRLNEGCAGLGSEAYVVCSEPDRYVDGLVEGPDGEWGMAPVWSPRNRVGSVLYHDVSGYLDLPWNARVTLGVNNLFDRDPPVSVTLTNSFKPEYQVPGRFLYMRYHQSF